MAAGHIKKAVVLLLVGIAATAAGRRGRRHGRGRVSLFDAPDGPLSVCDRPCARQTMPQPSRSFVSFRFMRSRSGFARGELWKAGVAALLFGLHVLAVVVGMSYFQH